MKNYRGIWFFGHSGVGKTFASKFLDNKINQSIKLDGDVIRKFLSNDLGYSIDDRKVQINRILNLAKIMIYEKKIPIISSVYFSKELLIKTKKERIVVIKIVRDKHVNDKLKNLKENVVGMDIKLEKIDCDEIKNDEFFLKELTKKFL